MKFLLDTNAVIALFKQHPELVHRITREATADVAISAITLHELSFGAYRSPRPQHHLARLDTLQFEVLDLDPEDSRISGQVRASLAAAGTPIGILDILIASQALSRDLTLVTHNLRDFQRIPGLKLEDWEGADPLALP